EDMPHDEPRTQPKATGKPATAPAAERVIDVRADREPGDDSDAAPANAGPDRVRMPANGSRALEDAAAIGAECMRLAGGDVKAANDLMFEIAGVRTCRGMKADAVRGAWMSLADHPKFGLKK